MTPSRGIGEHPAAVLGGAGAEMAALGSGEVLRRLTGDTAVDAILIENPARAFAWAG